MEVMFGEFTESLLKMHFEECRVRMFMKKALD